MMSVGRGRDDGRGNARGSHRFIEVPDRLVLAGNGGCSQMRVFGVHVLSVRFGLARNRHEFNQGSTVV